MSQLTWQEQAACAGVDPELFYLEDNVRGRQKEQKEAAAKAVCATCPVIAECLAYAMSDRHTMAFGVFGGTTPEERTRLQGRTKHRGRPV